MKLDQKSRKKALLLLIVLFLAMLIPMKIQHTEGGTIQYKAVFYSVIQHFHEPASQNYQAWYGGRHRNQNFILESI